MGSLIHIALQADNLHFHQGVVKNPVLPDQASRAKLQEKQSSLFAEKYEDFIRLGVEEWGKTYKELEPTGKKSILFIMTDDTKNCDDVAEEAEGFILSKQIFRPAVGFF